MTVKRYQLAKETSGYGAILTCVVMAGFGLWMLATGRGGDMPLWYKVPFWTFWFGALGYGVYLQGTAARAIVVHGEDHVEFVSLWRRTSMRASEIRSIRARSGEDSDVVVGHTGGSIRLAGPFNQFHQFVTEISLANPGIQLSGV